MVPNKVKFAANIECMKAHWLGNPHQGHLSDFRPHLNYNLQFLGVLYLDLTNFHSKAQQFDQV